MTKEQARIIILEYALDHAIKSIEFMHGCLTDDRYEYSYPELTLDRLKGLRELVPEQLVCPHSKHQKGCDACVERFERMQRLHVADETLRSTDDLTG